MIFNRTTVGIILGAAALTPSIIIPGVHAKEVSQKVIAFVRPSPTPTNTPTPTQTPTPTFTPTPTPTPKPTPSPTLSPTPTPIPITGAQLDEWFTKYANHYSVDRERLRRIAICESNLRPAAVNGPYVGMYQFGPTTWKAVRGRMNADPTLSLRTNAEESIKTAAFKMSTDGNAAWPNCGK
jgi:Transglycosylase-like domain